MSLARALLRDPRILLLTLIVLLWVGGFDVLYACQDFEHDRSVGLHSVPQAFGLQGAFSIARAMHQLGAEATEAYEGGRDKVASFIGAPDRDEVIFTKNATEGLNLAANTLAWPGDRNRRGVNNHYNIAVATE